MSEDSGIRGYCYVYGYCLLKYECAKWLHLHLCAVYVSVYLGEHVRFCVRIRVFVRICSCVCKVCASDAFVDM